MMTASYFCCDMVYLVKKKMFNILTSISTRNIQNIPRSLMKYVAWSTYWRTWINRR